MNTLAIVTSDPELTDPSIKILAQNSQNFNLKVKIIGSKKDLTSDFKPSVLYPRINPGYDRSKFVELINLYRYCISNYQVSFINSPELLELEYDKYEMAKKAESLGFLTPKTYKLKDLDKLSFPMVLKEVHGYGGQGVFLVVNKEDLKSKIDEKRDYLVQEYIKLKNAEDFRVYVVGGEVAGGLYRQNLTKNEFRSNSSQGGKVRFFKPDKKLSLQAVNFAKKIGGDVLCIDFIFKEGKYYFIEFNHAFSVKTENEPEKIEVVNKILEYCSRRADNGK